MGARQRQAAEQSHRRMIQEFRDQQEESQGSMQDEIPNDVGSQKICVCVRKRPVVDEDDMDVVTVENPLKLVLHEPKARKLRTHALHARRQANHSHFGGLSASGDTPPIIGWLLMGDLRIGYSQSQAICDD